MELWWRIGLLVIASGGLLFWKKVAHEEQLTLFDKVIMITMAVFCGAFGVVGVVTLVFVIGAAFRNHYLGWGVPILGVIFALCGFAGGWSGYTIFKIIKRWR